MKKILLFISILGILYSCEDVIDVDLNESESRLVIDASMNLWDDGNFQTTVKLTTTAPFFDEEIPFVNDAFVEIIDENGLILPFVYAENGIYVSTIQPQSGVNYTLKIRYQEEIYTATEQLETVAPLEFVEQKNDGGFTGEDIELKAFFTDPANIENFYFFEGLSVRGASFDALKDEFFDGNQIFGFYFVENIETGDEVIFNLYGIDEQFYNYMFTLLQQSQGDGPFETQPATVRGNIINETNLNNYPLGYFRISEVSTISYTVE